jgi:hypothetical protein
MIHHYRIIKAWPAFDRPFIIERRYWLFWWCPLPEPFLGMRYPFTLDFKTKQQAQEYLDGKYNHEITKYRLHKSKRKWIVSTFSLIEGTK